ncbi:hypothetical protein CYMTET_25452 [Cymbomonas tetramitiformis]|uniref:Uncharacterized protein n=1 Tax=Cymbomonas tetramitiformis TaxID=36881 RepID=A0AAE0KYW8_9CHLO|nr:hypothetical protein CYMTET_25452 [Cymbomonas tetramitiformis]
MRIPAANIALCPHPRSFLPLPLPSLPSLFLFSRLLLTITRASTTALSQISRFILALTLPSTPHRHHPHLLPRHHPLATTSSTPSLLPTLSTTASPPTPPSPHSIDTCTDFFSGDITATVLSATVRFPEGSVEDVESDTAAFSSDFAMQVQTDVANVGCLFVAPEVTIDEFYAGSLVVKYAVAFTPFTDAGTVDSYSLMLNDQLEDYPLSMAFTQADTATNFSALVGSSGPVVENISATEADCSRPPSVILTPIATEASPPPPEESSGSESGWDVWGRWLLLALCLFVAIFGVGIVAMVALRADDGESSIFDSIRGTTDKMDVEMGAPTHSSLYDDDNRTPRNRLGLQQSAAMSAGERRSPAGNNDDSAEDYSDDDEASDCGELENPLYAGTHLTQPEGTLRERHNTPGTGGQSEDGGTDNNSDVSEEAPEALHARSRAQQLLRVASAEANGGEMDLSPREDKEAQKSPSPKHVEQAQDAAELNSRLTKALHAEDEGSDDNWDDDSDEEGKDDSTEDPSPNSVPGAWSDGWVQQTKVPAGEE